MTINYVKTQSIGEAGQSPKIVYIDTNETLAEVTAVGYINNLARTNGLSEGDAVLITTKTTPNSRQKQLSFLDVTYVSGDWSLVPMTTPSTVVSVTGTANRITVTGTTNAVVNIASNYVGQNSITTLGTITTGVWNGTTMSVPYGGTGSTSFNAYGVVVGNTTSTGALQTLSSNGTSGQALISNGAAAYPTWQTLAGGGDMLLAGVQTVTGAKTFNSNTFILAGSTSGTTTINAAAIAGTTTISFPSSSGTVALTSDVPSLPVSLANGGTGASLTASNGGIFYSTGTVGAILAGTATAGKMLRSGASSAPTWSTATFPNTASNAGKLLRANGVNWVETTASFADTYGANEILFGSSTNNVSGLATANNSVLITSGAGVPSLGSTLPNAVQDNITRLGTITSGAWNGSNIGVAYGGTGNTTFTAYSVLCAGTTATGAFQNVSGLGTSGQVLTSQGAASLPIWTTPTTGGQVDSVTGTADRITVSGTAADPVVDIAATYVGQASITTLGTVTTGTWNATVIGLSYGGSGKALTADNGGIVYTDSNSMEILAATATAGQVLLSGSNAAPTWSTPTYPSTSGSAGVILRSDGTNNIYSTSTFADTYAASSLLYSNGANNVAALSTANNATLRTTASGVPEWAALADGEILIGSSAGKALAANITAGTGISVVNGNNTITVSTTATGITWNNISGTSQAAAVNNGYVVGNASQTTITLPATAALGSVVKVIGQGAAGWILAANTGQTIKLGGQTTSSAGNLVSNDQYDCITVVCVVANTTWVVESVLSQGLTIN